MCWAFSTYNLTELLEGRPNHLEQNLVCFFLEASHASLWVKIGKDRYFITRLIFSELFPIAIGGSAGLLWGLILMVSGKIKSTEMSDFILFPMVLMFLALTVMSIIVNALRFWRYGR